MEITNFKTVLLFKVIDNKNAELIDHLTIITNEHITNQIWLTLYNSKVKLKSHLKSTEVLLFGCEFEKVRLPNALVDINENDGFCITIMNINANQKLSFSNQSKATM